MINFDDYTNENRTEHNLKWPYITDHPYKKLTVGDSGSGKTNALLNLITDQPDIDKIYLYGKDQYKAKYQCLINKRGKVGLNHFNHLKAFMNIRMTCWMSTKILKITIQIKKEEFLMILLQI